MKLSKIRAVAITAALTAAFVSVMAGAALAVDGEFVIANGLITVYPGGVTNLLGLGSSSLLGDITSILQQLLGVGGIDILGRPLGL